MIDLLAAEWLRFSRRRINQVAVGLLVLAVCCRFWGDYRAAGALGLLDDRGAALARFEAMSFAEVSELSASEQERYLQSRELVLSLPRTFTLIYWISSWARAVWCLLAVIAVGSEFQWGTLRWRLSLGLGRVRWVAANVLVLMLSALATVLVLWLTVAGVGVYVHRLIFGDVPWGQFSPAFWWRQVVVLFRVWVGFWPWVGLGILLGVVGRSVVPTVALAAFGMLLERLWGYVVFFLSLAPVGSLPRWLSPDGPVGELYRWTVSYNVAAVLLWNDVRVDPGAALGLDWVTAVLASRVIPTSPGRAAWVMAVITLSTVALAVLVVARRDVTR